MFGNAAGLKAKKIPVPRRELPHWHRKLGIFTVLIPFFYR